MSPKRSRDATVPVYLFPCRVQQGWGDVAEIASVAWALHRARVPLLHLRDPRTPGSRVDPRAVPVDPREAGPVRFPPVREVTAPVPASRAMTITTWWGVTARTRDARGGPLPGTLEPRMVRLVEAYPAESLLHISLEEFASDQASELAWDETLRQAGWSARRRAVALRSAEGLADVRRYHDAFVQARGGERPDVLHLVGTWAPDPAALREFPFLLPVAPFGRHGRRPPARMRPTGPRTVGSRPHRIVWYASPESSAEFARRLLPALRGMGRLVRLDVRLPPERWSGFPTSSDPAVHVCLREEMAESAWRRWWSGADLRIATGSQTLETSVRLGLPFLYFNGLVQGATELPRAFRREKLLSLLRAWRRIGGAREVGLDLERFADGRDLPRILRSALGSASWGRREAEGLRRLPAGFPPGLRAAGPYVRQLLREFSRWDGNVPTFVDHTRRRHRSLVRSGGP